MTTPRPAASARARVRAELTTEIKDIARAQLATAGAAELSLRAIAREMGMVSSALYRYFASRDELLTALIVDAYEAVGFAATEAEAAARRTDLVGRWMATTRAVREWAVEHPHEYALIFGSPVPGYQAPQDTIDPAARIPVLLLAIVSDAPSPPRGAGRRRPLPAPVRADLRRLGEMTAPALEEHQLGRAVMAWSQIIGLISFELFGHLHNVITDYARHFDYQMRLVADDLGLSGTGRALAG